MTYLVVLRYDEAGTSPVILREDDHLVSSDGTRWRLVAHTDDPDQAARIVDQLREHHRPAPAPADPNRPIAVSS